MTFGRVDDPMKPGVYTPVILPQCYFAPSEWFAVAGHADIPFLASHENYVKQTWRNRCRIVGANGPIDLVIPVKLNGNHTPMKDVRVDYSTNWRHVHWHSIRSAYGKSPYFEFYCDRIAPLFEGQPAFLTDWNEQTLDIALGLLKMQIRKGREEEHTTGIEHDYREVLSPKWKGDRSSIPVISKYTQVFEEKHGFIPGLSILDLLFCNGPDARRILQEAK